MQPDFDQQALALGLYCTCHDAARHGAPGRHDTFCYIRRVSEALSAAYRAGLEHAAQLADESCYGKEAAARIREEVG